ncbi:MAG: hypothetical protein MZV65_35280 [Chromatiales bacterium]|nr:hypothetical protein [Chromatiales bacterium]
MPLNSPKVRIVNADAFNWLEQNAEVFDFIVVDFPDPTNYSLGKLYTNTLLPAAGQTLGGQRLRRWCRPPRRCSAPPVVLVQSCRTLESRRAASHALSRLRALRSANGASRWPPASPGNHPTAVRPACAS